MQVRFTKLSGRAYEIAVTRERGPELAPRRGPGYDDDLPHDIVHLVVEAEAGIEHGVYGQVAAGRNTLFWPVDAKERRRRKLAERRRSPGAAEDADMARSERLVGAALVAWARRADRAPGPGSDRPPELGHDDARVLPRIVDRLDAVAARWRGLPEGGGITLTWPG